MTYDGPRDGSFEDQDSYFEACDLSELAYKLWVHEWTDLHPYGEVAAQDKFGERVPIRCSIRMKRRLHEGDDQVVSIIQYGSELPASWFQQSNGCRRSWCAVAGEFEAR